MTRICAKVVGNSVLIAQRLQNCLRNQVIDTLLLERLHTGLPLIVMVLISKSQVSNRSGKGIIQQDNQVLIHQEDY